MNSPNLLSKFKELGIQGFFIVTDNGLPILDRVYTTEITSSGGVETLTSMISTVVQFNHKLVQDGLLTDIGLQTSRIYFDFIKEIIFVLLVEEKSLLNYKLLDVQTLLKGTISNIKSLFQVKFGQISDPDALDIFALKEIFGENILEKIDQMIHTSFIDLLNMMI
jgi:hypothetical protein